VDNDAAADNRVRRRAARARSAPKSGAPSLTSSSTGATTAPNTRLDPFSTAFSFPHWRELTSSPTLFKPPPTYEPLVTYLPRTWLLRHAWRRARRPSIFDVPG